MSARSRYLLQRDLSREETKLGKKAREAGAYLQKEKTISQVGGGLGAWIGGTVGATAIQTALFGAGPVGWAAAAIGTGIGYMVGAKAGEEVSESIEEKKLFVLGEDKYSREDSDFYRDMEGGKFLKESKAQTRDDLMTAKKQTDIIGGIGKESLMVAASAGIKTKWANKTLNYAGKPISSASKDVIDKTIKDAIPVPDIINEQVIAGQPGAVRGIEGVSRGQSTLMTEAGSDYASKSTETYGLKSEGFTGKDYLADLSKRKYTGPSYKDQQLPITSQDIADIIPDTETAYQQSLETLLPGSTISSGGKIARLDATGKAVGTPSFGITPEMEKGLTTRGKEVLGWKNKLGENIEHVGAESNVPVLDQSVQFHEKNLLAPDTKYETGSKTVDLKGDYLSKFGETRNPTKAFENLDAGFAGDIPEELAHSPKELKRMKNAQVQSMWDTQKSDMGIDKPPFSGGRDFAGKTKATINEIDFGKTMGRDIAKSQSNLTEATQANLTDAIDVKVTAATAEQTQNMYDIALRDFYKQDKTAKEAYDLTGGAKGFENLPFYEKLKGERKINKFFNWHDTTQASFK